MGADRITRRVHLATGVTVPYLEQGDPQPAAVLLLHAWVESSACFDRLWQAVPPTLRVFAMDQRGHGDADKPADGYALVNFADDIEAFMDAVGLQSYVEQQVAVQAPHRVDGLVLVGAPRSLRGRPAFADEVDRLTDPVDPTWVEESLTWFPRYHDVPDWYIKDRIRDGLRVPAHVWMARRSHPRLPAYCVREHRPPRAVGAARTRGHRPSRLRRRAFNLGSEQHADLVRFGATVAAGGRSHDLCPRLTTVLRTFWLSQMWNAERDAPLAPMTRTTWSQWSQIAPRGLLCRVNGGVLGEPAMGEDGGHGGHLHYGFIGRHRACNGAGPGR